MNELVYSTESGRIKSQKEAPAIEQGDGIVRIQRQVSGRKGKGVCVISGLALDQAGLMKLAGEIKKKCGCGGSVKEQTIEIQGEQKELIKKILEDKGFKVKFSGG